MPAEEWTRRLDATIAERGRRKEEGRGGEEALTANHACYDGTQFLSRGNVRITLNIRTPFSLTDGLSWMFPNFLTL